MNGILLKPENLEFSIIGSRSYLNLLFYQNFSYNSGWENIIASLLLGDHVPNWASTDTVGGGVSLPLDSADSSDSPPGLFWHQHSKKREKNLISATRLWKSRLPKWFPWIPYKAEPPYHLIGKRILVPNSAYFDIMLAGAWSASLLSRRDEIPGFPFDLCWKSCGWGHSFHWSMWSRMVTF